MAYYVIAGSGRAGVHTGFRTITLGLYIGSLPNLVTSFPCGRGRTLFFGISMLNVPDESFPETPRAHLI